VIRLLLASAVAFAQPMWVPASASFEYFRYGDGQAIEQKKPQTAQLPFDFRFPAPPAPVRKVCALENRPGVFWFTPGGKPLNHTFVTPNPSDFRVSAIERGIRGFAVTARFAGSAKRMGAIDVVYFADRECSDASLEYGFSRDLATDSILVYWATFANCGNDALSLCRKTDSGALGENFSNVQQENSGVKVSHGFRIYGLETNRPYTFKISREARGFRIEVWDELKLARCSEGGSTVACSFHKETEPWFPLASIANGYIIAGTQVVGDPQIAQPAHFEVSSLQVAR
jgi:hypothetical protein